MLLIKDYEDDEELKYSILNYLSDKKPAILKKESDIRKNKRSRSTVLDPASLKAL
jgi:hypothetical protein